MFVTTKNRPFVFERLLRDDLSADLVQNCTTILIIHERRLIRRIVIATFKSLNVSQTYCRNRAAR